ncbi:MAG: selenide, water dikinase SelD [Calditrichaceae bacterium]|nr:selenide, water dikinase SelD [Calditrichaceae bacterium]
MSPGDLEKLLCGFEIPTNSNVLVGLQNSDDAGVYKISEDLALIQTVDFFTPIVDDPYWFGQIAAANALSDVYAMGGQPVTAMNLVAFPTKIMEFSVLRKIIQGGLDKLKEADVALVGGHSIEDNELKYGLSVTGFVHPKKYWSKHGLKPGDNLILTKAIGTGIISTAIKGGLASVHIVEEITQLMATLNKQAALRMKNYPVNACTDITGFGLLGHLAEMVVDSGCSARIESGAVPVIKEAIEFAGMGLFPGGAFKNKQFRLPFVEYSDKVDPLLRDIFFDPQTSGGLLISIPEEYADQALADLRTHNCTKATIIGKIISDQKEKIYVV